MDYQTQQELGRKADLWKVEELSRTVDNLRRENSNLQEDVRRLSNNNTILHEALRETLQAFTEADNFVQIDQFHTILNKL